MARETALWGRCLTAKAQLIEAAHRIDIQRLENAVGSGHPDVDECLDGIQIWLELKSAHRPARASTPIRMRTNKTTRAAQIRWHRRRGAAGCKTNFILLQVGDAHKARLYLVPGPLYSQIEVSEADLEFISLNDPRASIADIMLLAAKGY